MDEGRRNSPLLRGGRALQQTVHSFVAEKTPQDYERMRGQHSVIRQLFASPIKASPPNGSRNNIETIPLLGIPSKEDAQMKDSLSSVHLKLEQHEKNMAQTTEEVEKLRTSSTCCVRRVDGLEDRLTSQHQLVQHVLQQTHRALEQQRLLLSTQQTIIQKICSEHSSTTSWLSDAAHIGLVLYILRQPSVRYVLWLLVYKLTTRQRHQTIAMWIIRLLLFAQMLKVTRTLDQWFGVTRRMSSISSDSMNFVSSVLSGVYRFGSNPLASFTSTVATK